MAFIEVSPTILDKLPELEYRFMLLDYIEMKPTFSSVKQLNGKTRFLQSIARVYLDQADLEVIIPLMQAAYGYYFRLIREV